MSYSSESEIPLTIKLCHIQDVIELLGYKKINNMVGGYFWCDENDYRSWYGVELQLYRESNCFKIETRSPISRSYWDLKHQNKTLKTIRDLFGGHFRTDAGRNRYWHPEEPPPSPLSSGCYLARWRFNNALIKARIYLSTRKLEGGIARQKPSGLPAMDEMNPRLLSNNLLIPYVIAIWEEYFRATFVAALKYSEQRESVLKKARLSHRQLEQIAVEAQPIERAIAEYFSFQRPSTICENFKLLDQKLDLGAAMRKPYNRRKTSLYDSIEQFVEGRNSFVHAGLMDMELYDEKLNNALVDVVEAVDRGYATLGKHYGFSPLSDAISSARGKSLKTTD